jgi:ABC-type branched-subunit amino acid transport system ATPase component
VVRFVGGTSELIERRDLLRWLFLDGAARKGVGGGNGASDGAGADPGAGAGALAGNGSNGGPPVVAATAGTGAEDGVVGSEVALEVVDLTKRYGGVSAVSSVSFELRDGEILGLIGPNGAGKTTLFDLISGFQSLDGGRVYLYGRDITGKAPHARAKVGLGRSFQNAQLWPSLTVREAVATACEHQVEVGAALPAFLHLPMVADSEARVMAHAEDLLELLNLARHGDKFISELSTGMRRMVDLAVQLAAEPSVLLLDEPSSGIAQRETEALGPILKDVQRHLGCSILIIEHDMPLITGLADRLVALETGRVVTTGRPEEVLRDPRVVEAYLGRAD